MLHRAESLRQAVHSATDRAHKSAMGQFMTNARVAAFMAGMFEARPGKDLRLLDPGAGLGALTCAVLERKDMRLDQAAVEAWELDKKLAGYLRSTLNEYVARGVNVEVHEADFLAKSDVRQRFTHCCMNPPYKKIGTDSLAREHARRFGLETVNLYSAFVGAALEQLESGGQLVAIIPRSFANGPYYKPFRRFILDRAAIRRIHLFDSRQKAFSDDDVLQENVIILLERDGLQEHVVVSTSTDDTFEDLAEKSFSFDAIVQDGDDEVFIHMPTEEQDPFEGKGFEFSLGDLGLSVSTGPVVDFRLREQLRQLPESGAVPLLYSHHLQGTRTVWPTPESKKPNAIAVDDESKRWLVPAGRYLVLRRFSAKEEKRRLVASMVDATQLGDFEWLGIENHLNYFHQRKQPLPTNLAWGLFVYLNSTQADEHLRRFSGHTQVNATDLRNIRYPSLTVLESWGQWAATAENLDQSAIDARVAA